MKKTGAVLEASQLLPEIETSSTIERFTPMLPFGESTIALHLIGMLQKLDISPILVVAGECAEELEKHLSHTGVRFLKNERYAKAQDGDSLIMGAQAICGECQRLLFMPVDTPAIMADTFRQVLMVDAPVVRAAYKGEGAYPVMVSSQLIQRLCRQGGGEGILDRIEYAGIPVTNVEVGDEGVCRRAGTREEYSKLIQWNFERGGGYPIHPVVRVCLTANNVFFGPGTAMLLDNIQRTGSIQEACAQMEMSYSKGSRLIKKAERQLGFPVTERRTGGSGGGGTVLTEDGKRLLRQYKRLVNQVQKSAENIYKDYFGKGIRE